MSTAGSCIAYEQLCLRPSDGSAVRGSLRMGHPAAIVYDDLCRQAWYELALIRCKRGNLDWDAIMLGPELLSGVLVQIGGLIPGVYAVRARIWSPRKIRLPDWGVLLVRPSGRWVLRARDGSQSVCPDGRGGIAIFGVDGGELWL